MIETRMQRRLETHPAVVFTLLILGFLVGCAAGGTHLPPWSESEGSPAGNYLAGLHALQAGDYRTALAHLARTLQAQPENVELRRQVLRLQVATGAFAEAVRSANELLELGADLAEVRLVLAASAAASADFAKARSHLREIRGHGALRIAVPLLDAWVLFAQEGLQAAIPRLGRESAGEDLRRLHDYHRALMYALAGDIETARRVIGAWVGESLLVPTALAQAAAAIFDRAGERERALGMVRAQLRFVPENTLLRWLEQRLVGPEPLALPVSDPLAGMAETLAGLALILAEQNAADESVFLAHLATSLWPEHDEAWLLVARLALERRDHLEAIRAVEKVRAASPLAWEASLLRANALIEAGRREEAVALLRRMAAERPDQIDALVVLGDYFRREQHYAEAERAYAEALRRIPELTAAHWRLLYVHGITLERTGRWEEAERAFLKALEFEPDQPYVLNYLGYSWVEKGFHLERAKDMLHRAVELRPRDGFIVDSLGWAYYQLGDYERAVEYLERAVELEPGDPVINDHLGDAYWRVGRRREAYFQWQRALSLKPEPDLVPKIEHKLRFGLENAAAVSDSG